MSDREIKWALATQYRDGRYQETFRFDMIESALNHMSQYFQVRFKRVNKGWNFLVLQSNKAPKNLNTAAWVSGNTIYISPVYNFGKSAALTAKVILHEFGHIGNGTSHSKDAEALMAPNAGISHGWVKDDLKWFNKYKLRAGLPPKGSIKNAFSFLDNPVIGENTLLNSYLDISIKCEHRNTIWDRITNYYDILTANYLKQ